MGGELSLSFKVTSVFNYLYFSIVWSFYVSISFYLLMHLYTTYPVKEGQRYINLNPGRLFVQQPP